MKRYPSSGSRWGRAVAFSACLIVTAGGCDGDQLRVYPVRGKIVLPDGSHLSGAGYAITFRSEVNSGKEKKYISADAPIGADGTFKPSSFRFEDGLVAGEHSVVIAPLPGGPNSPVDGPTQAVRLPSKYQRQETSGLKVTVTPETSEVVLTVEVEPAKKK